MKQDMIINADDFGKSRSVNAAIAECFSKGYISSTTLMVNMPYTDEAVNLAFQKGFSDKVGLHLNLTEGRYISHQIKSPYVAKEDRFNGVFHRKTATRLILPKDTIIEIQKEIDSQISKYLSYGFTNMHMDSHQHVHTDLPVFLALKNLFLHYQFRSLRISRNLLMGGLFSPLMIYKNLLNNKIKKISSYTTDFFGSFDDFLDMRSKAKQNIRSVELMCHPDYDNNRHLVNRYVDQKDSINIEKYFELIGRPKLISYPS